MLWTVPLRESAYNLAHNLAVRNDVRDLQRDPNAGTELAGAKGGLM